MPVGFREVHDRGPTGNPRWEERELRSQISQKDFGWRNAGAMARRVRADWKSVRKRADWKWQEFIWEWHHSRPCTSTRDSAAKLEETEPAEKDSEENEHLRRPLGHLHLRHPKERGQSHRSVRPHQMWGDFEESRLQHRIGLGRCRSSLRWKWSQWNWGADGHKICFSLGVWFSCDEQEGLFNLGCTERET